MWLRGECRWVGVEGTGIGNGSLLPILDGGFIHTYELGMEAIDRRAVPDTPDALVRVASGLFAAQGYEGTSVREITSAADANLGAITYHFGSKEALYRAVLERAVAPLAHGFAEALGSGVPDQGDAPGPATGTAPLDRIERFVRLAFEHFASHPHLPRLIMREISTGGAPPEPVLRVILPARDALARLIREGQRKGTVREGVPELMALSVFSQPVYLNLVRQFVPRMAASSSGAATSSPGLSAFVDHAAAFVRAGLEARPGASESVEGTPS